MPGEKVLGVPNGLVVNKPPNVERHHGEGKQAQGKVEWQINAGKVQNAEEPDKQTCANHEQDNRSALEDPDTGSALSCIVVSMDL
jgi:hypothetical protein